MATTGEGLAFLQARIALFWKFGALLTGAFLVGSVLLFLSAPAGAGMLLGRTSLLARFSHPAIVANLAGTIVAVVAWLVLRGPPRSFRTIVLVDMVVGFLLLSVYALSFAGQTSAPAALRPDLLMILVASSIVTLRGIAIPASVPHTLLTSTLAMLPALGLAAFFTWSRRSAPALGGASYPTMLFDALWCAMPVAIAGFASRVIYNLRAEVAEARRLGQYLLDDKIGEGGMGAVYRAHHAMLRRPTAVKLLLPDRLGAASLARFEREVQITATLTHPNTVSIFDYGRTPDGIFYYAMEYLEGVDLQSLVRRFGPQPAPRVIHLLLQVCGSLGEAHARGLVHRDIKPANLILCERGGVPDTVKVVDFGLVKDITPSSSSAPLTQADAILGTPLYMAPEALRGGPVDARVDLYAVGAVGYFLLTGHPVFEAASVLEICALHFNAEPVAPSERLGAKLPADLEAVLLGCLAKVPAARPPTAAAVGRALRACAVPPWTEEDARAWWAAHGKPAAADVSASEPTLPAEGSPTELANCACSRPSGAPR